MSIIYDFQHRDVADEVQTLIDNCNISSLRLLNTEKLSNGAIRQNYEVRFQTTKFLFFSLVAVSFCFNNFNENEQYDAYLMSFKDGASYLYIQDSLTLPRSLEDVLIYFANLEAVPFPYFSEYTGEGSDSLNPCYIVDGQFCIDSGFDTQGICTTEEALSNLNLA